MTDLEIRIIAERAIKDAKHDGKIEKDEIDYLIKLIPYVLKESAALTDEQ